MRVCQGENPQEFLISGYGILSWAVHIYREKEIRPIIIVNPMNDRYLSVDLTYAVV